MASAAILAGGRASRFGGRDKSALIVEGLPIPERGYHPLCAAYARACQPAIAVRLDRGQLRMVDFLADVRVRVVCGDELAALGDHHRLLANINTPAEHEGLDRTLGHEL